MNVFKNMIPLIALFCINSVTAKPMGGARSQTAPAPVVKQPITQQPAVQQPVVRQPSIQQPVMQEKSYRDLVNYVKKASNAWDRANASLNVKFIFDLMEKAQQLKLDNTQLQALLQTARDAHGVFTGNQAKDKNILLTIEAQIQAALNQRRNI